MRNGSNNKKAKEKTGGERPIRVEPGSGNVFADLAIPNPDLALAKAQLVQRIRELISAQELTQSTAAELLGVDQPKVSAIVRGKVEGYTIDRLFRFLTALGQEVRISVTPYTSRKRTEEKGAVVVV